MFNGSNDVVFTVVVVKDALMRTAVATALLPTAVLQLCRHIESVGGHAWLVGGSVRDLALGVAVKDWDIEVYGLEPVCLGQALQSLGHCEHIGRHFGVMKLWFSGLEVDVALPRTEIKKCDGHKGFAVTPSPYLLPEKAVLRRDFTINAMMFDPLTQTFLDFHNGLVDLNNKVLRHVSAAFVEDPLRPLRAMQFAARFQLSLATKTALLCRKLLVEFDTLPTARIWQEWLKWAQADCPSFGLRALQDMGWLSRYPELAALLTKQQQDMWHQTCCAVDAVAKLRKKRSLQKEDGLLLMFVSLCCKLDQGEAVVDAESLDKTCPASRKILGAGAMACLLRRLGLPKKMRAQALILGQECGLELVEKVSVSAVNRLAYRLTPLSIKLWEVLLEASAIPNVRPGLPWLKQATIQGVQCRKVEAIVTGKLLLEWGIKPSPGMGKLLKCAYEAQMDDLFCDKATAYSWLKKNDVATVIRQEHNAPYIFMGSWS